MATAVHHATDNEVTILAHFLVAKNGQLPPDVSGYILDLTVNGRDKARMHNLAVPNQDDALTPAEKEEVVAFAKATSLLSILKSKARRTLGIKLETCTVLSCPWMRHLRGWSGSGQKAAVNNGRRISGAEVHT